MDPKSLRNAALMILALGVLRHYGYKLAAPEHVGALSKALGGVALLALTPIIYQWAPSRLMLAVLAWWCFEALQVTICSLAYMVAPWVVPLGESICSARIGFDLGALGVMAAAVILWRTVKVDRYERRGNKP